MQLTKNFSLQEWIDRETFKVFGGKAIRLLDMRIVHLYQSIRDDLGKPITINDWHYGGNRQFSGFRPWLWPYHNKSLGLLSEKELSAINFTSQHKFGRAGDALFMGEDIEEIREYVIENRESLFPTLMRVEMGVSWLHLDVACTPNNSLVKFNG